MEALLAERLRRTLKARVRKSVGSIPTDCIDFLLFLLLLARGGFSLRVRSFSRARPEGPIRPRIAQLAERETVDGYN